MREEEDWDESRFLSGESALVERVAARWVVRFGGERSGGWVVVRTGIDRRGDVGAGGGGRGETLRGCGLAARVVVEVEEEVLARDADEVVRSNERREALR